MSTDPEPVASECDKAIKPSAPERPEPDAESDGDGSQAAAASKPPEVKEDITEVPVEVKRDSVDEMIMDIDNDLTTNERMPTVDELEQPKPKPKPKPVEAMKKEKEKEIEKEKENEKEETLFEEQEVPRFLLELMASPPSLPAIKIEEDEEEKPSESSTKEKQLPEQQLHAQEDLPPSSPEAPPNPSQRIGKITRSSLNGTGSNQVSTRTPAIMKRLRKSTRFKAKPTGGRNNSAAAAAGNSSQNGHNNSTNNGAIGSSIHLAGAGAHPSNTNKHGRSGSGGPGGGSAAARSRRTLFKRPAQKTPKVQACTKFVKSVFYKGSYMQIGDIVSIVDGEQNLYYAQIRGLLVDAYCEKSAFLTWLIPTQDSPDPQEGFDPATYLIGPDEELSRKLCYLEFVMHAPSNYYFDRSTPFPLPDVDEYTAQRSGGYIWTRLPVLKREKLDRESRGHKASGVS